MKIKELFILLETANKLNKLLKEKQRYIEISFDFTHNYEKINTFYNFKKYIKKEYIIPFNIFDNIELVQSEDYHNYFEGKYTFEDQIETISFHFFEE